MKQKGGNFLMNMVSAGVGAYAAKKSSNVNDLLWRLFKYAVVIFVVFVVIGVVLRALGFMERFTMPVKPSKEGDEKVVTPAGNVIIY
jgi:hypothetical protein